jgi:hypothetical protein
MITVIHGYQLWYSRICGAVGGANSPFGFVMNKTQSFKGISGLYGIENKIAL